MKETTGSNFRQPAQAFPSAVVVDAEIAAACKRLCIGIHAAGASARPSA
jgi:hypothetical protein